MVDLAQLKKKRDSCRDMFEKGIRGNRLDQMKLLEALSYCDFCAIAAELGLLKKGVILMEPRTEDERKRILQFNEDMKELEIGRTP